MKPVTHRRPPRPLAAVIVVIGLASCGSGTPVPATTTGPRTTGVTATSTASATATTSGTGTARPDAGPTSTPELSCPEQLAARLTAAEKAGQLLMVGLDVNAGNRSLDTTVRTHHVGGVILLGGWFGGMAQAKAATDHLSSLAGQDTGGMGLLIAGDAEGGQVQQPRGDGFTRLPTALTQGRMDSADLVGLWKQVGAELLRAGVNVDLAPVTDTVPTDIGARNEPIGQWERQYSGDPTVAGRAASDVIAGLHDAGVMTSIKHFPGLGRITGNTDFADGDITDEVATVDDPYLEPFRAGIRAGTDMVMVGSAWYPKLDADNQAMFSRAIVTGLLREGLGWQGVTITDDVGAAKAVARVEVSQRALRFISAGGDIVLTARPGDVPVMARAIVARMGSDAAFAALVDRSVERVVAMKSRYGLTPCP